MTFLIVFAFVAGLVAAAMAMWWAIPAKRRAVTASRGGGRRCGVCRAAVVEEDSVFCPRCGARLTTSVTF